LKLPKNWEEWALLLSCMSNVYTMTASNIKTMTASYIKGHMQISSSGSILI